MSAEQDVIERLANKRSLAAKLAKVANAVGKVEKKGYNEQGKYHYARATDVFDEVRRALASEKVALTFAIDPTHTTFEKGSTASGGTAIMATLWIAYRFHDGDSGETFECVTVATARDVGQADKAAYKAQTNALKYLLFQVFQISTGDDDVEAEGGAPKDEPRKPAAARKPAPKESTPAATKSAPATEESAPAAAKSTPKAPEITDEQRADARYLNESLPELLQWSNKEMRGQLVALGVEGLVKALVDRHRATEGDACTHYGNAVDDGRIIVKRPA